MSPILTVTSGLLCHWDFSGPDPMSSKGSVQSRLVCQGSPVQAFASGPVAASAVLLPPGTRLLIPLDGTGSLENALEAGGATVVGWMKAGSEKAAGPGPKSRSGDWTFFSFYLDRTSQIPVFSSGEADSLHDRTLTACVAGPSEGGPEGIYLEAGSGAATGCFSMFSGLTLFSRRLSLHEIHLIYHHL